MRLWHKDLIGVLPEMQLKGQWRECVLIAKAIHEKGTPNHLLVNKVLWFQPEHFYTYCAEVWAEMTKRGYNAQWQRIALYFDDDIKDRVPVRSSLLFSDWHNDRYMRQCLFNLQEKFDCGGIPEADAKKLNLYHYA